MGDSMEILIFESIYRRALTAYVAKIQLAAADIRALRPNLKSDTI
jgi:hypothetical protein